MSTHSPPRDIEGAGHRSGPSGRLADPATSRAWIEISAEALRANYRGVREWVAAHVPKAKPPGVLPMIKADAYGLGVDQVVEVLQGEGPAAWGVATLGEALHLRSRASNAPVQIFSPLPPGGIEHAWGHGVRVSLSALEELDAIPTGIRGSFDVELDTGMGRAGFRATDPPDVAAWARALVDRVIKGGLEWHGVFTHLHSADLDDGAEARRRGAAQIEVFSRALEVLDTVCDEAGLPRLRRHMANSAAALRFPELMRDIPGGVDAVRPGIVLYGVRPFPMGPTHGTGIRFEPRPVVSVRARVARVVDVPSGATVGYGATHVADGARRWATVLIGYGDGLPRALSNRGRMLVGGESVPIIGRISMDMTVVDVTSAGEVRPGDVATVVGDDGGGTVSLEEIAAVAGAIPYEILTGWGRRLPRIWRSPEGEPGPVTGPAGNPRSRFMQGGQAEK
jgi:alanine racemase